MEECESLDSEMAEMQEFREALGPEDEDEDEVEELRNSLREVVQDPSVRPSVQCLLVDPSFSMVTVQSEDSGIVWETASSPSRCSTPGWASETCSSVSEAYNMGDAGKITIIFDEDKVIRRRTRSGSRSISSRLSDRFRRTSGGSSSRCGSVLGVERLEMAEVSVPNVRTEGGGNGGGAGGRGGGAAEPDLEEIRDKDQQLFSLISDGYEILNIRVPSKLPTVDEEESTELPDNLSYMETHPGIRSRAQPSSQNHHVPVEEIEAQEDKEDQTSKEPSATQKPVDADSGGDMDYMEKFSLLDEVVPTEQAPEETEEGQEDQPAAEAEAEVPKPAKEAPGSVADSPALSSDDSFVFVSDVDVADDLAGDHLDEVFYGNGVEEDTRHAEQEFTDSELEEMRRRSRRESRGSVKESGSRLFGSQETILTPIYLPEGPPKIIDQILLDEPTAMSFMYTDLYEEAMGERTKSVEVRSEAETVAPERRFRRRLSDGEEDEANGSYLEMFTLKDDIAELPLPQPDAKEDKQPGSMMWPPSTFEMTGCLQRVEEEEEEEVEDKKKVKEPETEEIIRVAEADHAELTESIADKVEVKTDKTEERKVQKKEDARNKEKEAGVSDSQPPSQRQKIMDETVKEETAAEVKVPVSTEVPQLMLIKTDEGSEEAQVAKDSPEGAQVTEVLSEEAVPEPETVAAVENVEKLKETLAVEAEVPALAKEPEAISQEEVICTDASAEAETSTEAPVDGKLETVVAETLPPVEVITDSEPAIQAVIEVIEGAADETQVQTQVQIALREVITEETPEVESSGADVFPEPDSEAKPEPLVPEEVKPADADETPSHVPESIRSKTDKEAERTELAADDSKIVVPETVSVGNEIIVLVPRGKVVEMDIEIGQISDAVARPEPESAQEDLVSPDTTSPASPPPQAPAKNSATEPEPHVEPSEESSVAEMATEVIERWPSPPAPVMEEEEEAEAEEKISDLEEDERGFLPLRSFTGQEDLSALITEPSGTEEREDETSGVTDVPQTDTDRDVTRPEIEMHKTPAIPHTEDAAEQMKDDVGLDVELRTEDEGQEIELHMEVSGNATELHKEDVAPETETCRVAEDIPETDVHKDEIVPEIELLPEDVVSEDIGQEIELHKDDISPEIKLHTEDIGQDIKVHTEDVGPETELHKDDVGQEMKVRTEDAGQEIDLHKMDEGPEMELREGEVGQEVELRRDVSEAPRVVPEEPGYEIISQQEAKEVQEPVTETRPEAEELPRDDSARDSETKAETKVETEETALELPSAADEELIEEDYDIIDAEEESQARAAAELQGMDWFCVDCGCLLSQEHLSGAHKEHLVTSVETAYDNIKERLGDWISELQARSENIEDLVSELEMSYNTVEEQCAVSEESIQKQNEEMMALVMDQYNTMSLNMEEEKKSKLEQLYDQIVSFQESIDSAKVTLDTTSREAETDARSLEDIEARLKAALDSAMSLELGPRGLLVFEDYTKKSSSSSSTAPCNSLPVPQKPSLVEQEAGSASSTSVTVYWRVNPGDIIDCFQVYCMEDPQGAVSEEYRVTVKESFCVLEELEADKTYKVWAMAVNATGCSLPSDRLVFRTAPSVPVIQPERCSVLGNWATLRWTPTTSTTSTTTPPLANTEISYTLEYCRQYELEGEGLRSMSGIRATEQAVLLQPNEKYLFYIKAVNHAGASEQSEAALISTKSSRFHLLKTSSHPSLELSDDHTTVHLHQDRTHTQCPSILGELLPARGCHYWETNVAGSTAYRVGVAYETANRDSPLGEDSSSWCLHCVPTPSSCRLELLNAGVQCAVFVVEVPQRLGVLLDHPHDSLSFYNAQTGQLLGTMSQRFTQPCHPALGLEAPGSLELCMVPEVPEFTKRS